MECRCLKWSCMTHLDNWNTTSGQKKGWESNWHFDPRPLKIRNRLDFLTCKWRETYCLKALDEGYNFVSYFISIRGLHTKLWASKVAKVQTLKILGLPFGSLGTKWDLDVSPMAMHRVYYKGEGGGFPLVRTMVGLVNSGLPMAHPNTKSAPAMH